MDVDGGWPGQDPGHVPCGAQEEADWHVSINLHLELFFLLQPQNDQRGETSSGQWPCEPVLQ